MRKAKRIYMNSSKLASNQQELYALEMIAELIVKISLSNFKGKTSHEEKVNTVKKRHNEH